MSTYGILDTNVELDAELLADFPEMNDPLSESSPRDGLALAGPPTARLSAAQLGQKSNSTFQLPLLVISQSWTSGKVPSGVQLNISRQHRLVTYPNGAYNSHPRPMAKMFHP